MRHLYTCSMLQLLALVPAVCVGAAAATETSTRAPTAAARDVPHSTRGVWAAHPAGTSHSNAPSSSVSLLTSSCLCSASSPSESPPSLAAPPDLSVSPSADAVCEDHVSCIGRHSQRGVVTASHTADADADGDSDAAADGDSDAAADGDSDAAADGDGDGGADVRKADGPGRIGGGGRTRHAEGKGT
ncbi:unnamed protein product [Closterium sp. NIES-53]